MEIIDKIKGLFRTQPPADDEQVARADAEAYPSTRRNKPPTFSFEIKRKEGRSRRPRE